MIYAAEKRVMTIRKLKKYKPTKFKAKGSHYDEEAADFAVAFIESLCHTKGTWAGKKFDLMDWQEQIIRDLFGTLKPNGYRQFNTAYVEIPKEMGKQLALDTLIPTPDGFTTMGDIQVGDVVFDEKGNLCHVVAKSKVDFEEQAYRITFKDGEVIEAGERHQWCGEYTHGKRKPRTMTTGVLFRMSRENGCCRFRIAVADAIRTRGKVLPIAPYLMGYWLGNGNAVKPEITVQTCDIPGVLSKILPCYADVSACELIVVYDEYRNKGIGTQALEELSSEFCGIVVAPDNENARRLYERLGREWIHEDADYIDQGFGVYEI